MAFLQFKNSDVLLESIREGRPMTRSEKLSLIVGLSIPSMLAQITNVLMFYIDAAMVGRSGARSSAAIGLVESSTWLFGSIATATSMGFSVQVANFIGANVFVKARQVFSHGLIASFVLSLVITLSAVSVARPLPYWLGGGPDIAPEASFYFLIVALAVPFFQLSSISASMCVFDVLFNYLFIFVCGLGVPGAALGTALAFVLAASVEAYFAVFRNRILSLRREGEKFFWVGNYIRNAFKIGFPMAVQSVLMGGAQIVSTVIVAPLGNIAIAANTFGITAESLCYMPGYGIGDAATTLVGQSNGAGRGDLCRSFARMTVFLAMLVMMLMGIVMYVFAPEMIGILTPVEEIRLLGTDALRIEAFAEPMFGAAIVT